MATIKAYVITRSMVNMSRHSQGFTRSPVDHSIFLKEMQQSYYNNNINNNKNNNHDYNHHKNNNNKHHINSNHNNTMQNNTDSILQNSACIGDLHDLHAAHALRRGVVGSGLRADRRACQGPLQQAARFRWEKGKGLGFREC